LGMETFALEVDSAPVTGLLLLTIVGVETLAASGDATDGVAESDVMVESVAGTLAESVESVESVADTLAEPEAESEAEPEAAPTPHCPKPTWQPAPQ